MEITREAIAAAAARLERVVLRTPVLPLKATAWDGVLPVGADVVLKLELFQQAGSFKARGAYLGISGLGAGDRAAGVVAASGGNHALAVSWAAKAAGVRARITMPHHVDPGRIDGCRALGAEVSLHDDMAAAFAEMERIATEGGAALMHPFEAEHMILGAATCGAEFLEQVGALDALIVPVGGGGLIAGMAAAAKLAQPAIEVIGVEPEGADSLSRSLAEGRPVTLDRIDTIADSLGSPKALPLSFGVAQRYVDRVVRLPDSALLAGMETLQRTLRIMAEPACAASIAALTGPLKDEMNGRRVGVIACGSNISRARYTSLLDG